MAGVCIESYNGIIIPSYAWLVLTTIFFVGFQLFAVELLIPWFKSKWQIDAKTNTRNASNDSEFAGVENVNIGVLTEEKFVINADGQRVDDGSFYFLYVQLILSYLIFLY